MKTFTNITDITSHMDSNLDIPKYSLLSLMSCLLVLGNGALIYTILRHKRLRSTTNLFVVALACADFSMGFPTIPIHILGEKQMFGRTKWPCLLSMGLTSAQIIVSVIMLFVLSVERYMNLVHPFAHRKYLTKRRAVIVIILCWIYALLFGMLPLFGWNSLENHSFQTTFINQSSVAELEVCRFQFVLPGSYVAFLFLGHIIPASLILPLLHIHVFLTARNVLWRHSNLSNQTRRGSRQSDQSLATRTRRNLRPFKILVLMVVYFIISWVPLTILEAIFFKGFTIPGPSPEDILVNPVLKHANYVLTALAVLNSVLNPLFYGLGNRHIWYTFTTGLKSACGCWK